MPSPAAVAAIAGNLARLRQSIAEAAGRAGRRPEAVELIAISKTQPPEAVAAAVMAGQRRFGESTVQEALAKMPRFAADGLEWHFIGHLQSNKARHLPGHFAWLHSLDGLRLAERVSRFAAERNVVVNGLIEVNVTRDPARHGVLPEALPTLLETLLAANLPGVALRGLMAIGPYPASLAEQRASFAAVRALRDQCVRRFDLAGFTELSMGMSGDFVAAILEGATLVRIGTAIFGERHPTG
jgi:pyridoxal phosphate enzyme (YggS family)